MTTVAFTQFLPEVLPHVQGCSDLLAVNAIRNACIEFCAGTMYWQETQDPETLTSADFPYDYPAPSGANVIQPMSVTIGGWPITAKSIDWLDANMFDWRNQTADSPRFFYQPNPNQMVLVPTPAGSITMTLRVAYIPTRDSSSVDVSLHQRYLDAIAKGALARLCEMPNQPWSNPTVAASSRIFFHNSMTDATIEANKAYARGSMRVQMRRG